MKKLQPLQKFKDILDNKLTRPQALGLMSFFQFISDISLAYSLYISFQYSGIVFLFGEEFKGPNFQDQVFKLMLMGLQFFLLVFLFSQLIFYIYLNLTYKKAAVLYFKIYAVFGFTLALLSTYYFGTFSFINMVFYLMGYYIFAREARLIKEQGQIPPLLAKLLPKKQ